MYNYVACSASHLSIIPSVSEQNFETLNIEPFLIYSEEYGAPRMEKLLEVGLGNTF